MIKIKLSVATNWDFRLIDELMKNRYPVRDVFGASQHTVVGGGRPTCIIPEVSNEEIVEYIKKVHKNNLEFTYLLNAPCMNNQEFVPEYHEKLLKELQWISDIGADNIVVTIPFLIELIKEQFPKIKIRVSTIARVNSVNKAKFFEMLGADEITTDVMINRDFITLSKIVKAVKCKITVLVTDGCLFECPFRQYHYNIIGHGSQTFHDHDRYYIDYPLIRCSIIKFSDPTEIMKCRWIRPEDLIHYEEIGIENFKIGGRRLPTDVIINSVNAYANREYKGNLVDIVQGFKFSFGSIQKLEPNKDFGETVEIEKKANLIIDNTKLDGFIDFFKNQNCTAMCNECNYCAEWAKKAIIMDNEGVQMYLDSLKTFYNNLITSREFGIKLEKPKKKKREKKGVEWEPETQELFNIMIGFSPPEFQSMARMVVGSIAEKSAKKRGSKFVEKEDIVKAFIEGTPGPFQTEMKENLKKLGLIADN
ncbi:MAG: U32 family peptidase [Candidatus Helarchaeota archaeon]